MSQEAVLQRIEEEHGHLSRLFTDIEAMFARLATEELEDAERSELLMTAAGDLDTALEEMLEHFEAEEQVLFVEIEHHFPEMAKRFELLVQNHESIYTNTRWLQRFLLQDLDAVKAESAAALEAIKAVNRDVEQHTIVESKVYEEALRRLPSDERNGLMQKLQDL